MFDQNDSRTAHSSELERAIQNPTFQLSDVVSAVHLADIEDRLKFTKSQLAKVHLDKSQIIHAFDFYLQLGEYIYITMTSSKTPDSGSELMLIANEAIANFCAKIDSSEVYERNGDDTDFLYFRSRRSESEPSPPLHRTMPKVIVTFNGAAKIRAHETLQKFYEIILESSSCISSFKITGTKESFAHRLENAVLYPHEIDSAEKLLEVLHDSFPTDATITLGHDFCCDEFSWSWNQRHAQVLALCAFEKLIGVDIYDLLSTHGVPAEMYTEELMMQLHKWLYVDPLTERFRVS